VPHINDTILLISAVTLLLLGNIALGNDNPWVIAKIIAMVLYISIGFFIFKSAKSHKSIYLMFLLAIIVYSYIIHTAITKSFNPFIY